MIHAPQRIQQWQHDAVRAVRGANESAGLPAGYELVLVIAKPRNFFATAPAAVMYAAFGSEARTLPDLGYWRMGVALMAAVVMLAAGFVAAGFVGALLGAFGHLYYASVAALGIGFVPGYALGPKVLRRYFLRFRPLWWVRRQLGEWEFKVDLAQGMVIEEFTPYEKGMTPTVTPIYSDPLYAQFTNPDLFKDEESGDAELTRRKFTAEYLFERVQQKTGRAWYSKRENESNTFANAIATGSLLMAMAMLGVFVFLMQDTGGPPPA